MFRTAEAATDTNWEAVNSAHLEPDPEEFKTADNAPVILDGSPGEDEVSNGLDKTDADLVVARLSPPLAFPLRPTGARLTSPLGWMMIGFEEGLSRGRRIIGTPATRTYLIYIYITYSTLLHR